jgi:hypothetical protein
MLAGGTIWYPRILNRSEKALTMIAKRIDTVARAVCDRHYFAPTQEHQLSAKLAEAIERKLAGFKTRWFTMGVAVQDFPDKGRGSWERPTGADLYISIVRSDQDEDNTFSKGMLVQSKWDRTFFPDREELQQQCKRMLARSRSSHVWVFGPKDVLSFDAKDIVLSMPLQGQTVGTQIAAGLRCHQGDVHIGRDTSKRLDRGLQDIMGVLAAENFFVNKGVAITLVKRQRTRRPRRTRRR